jgi:hypothetical protein
LVTDLTINAFFFGKTLWIRLLPERYTGRWIISQIGWPCPLFIWMRIHFTYSTKRSYPSNQGSSLPSLPMLIF